jgi:hypothetical protein
MANPEIPENNEIFFKAMSVYRKIAEEELIEKIKISIKNREDLKIEIENIWKQVRENLESEGIAVTENVETKFKEKLDEIWGGRLEIKF